MCCLCGELFGAIDRWTQMERQLDDAVQRLEVGRYGDFVGCEGEFSQPSSAPLR